MKIQFIDQYRKRGTGTMTFVYAVEGTEEQLAAYKAHKADKYRELKKDEKGFKKGTPLFFTTRYIGKSGKLMETSDKRWVLDTTEADKLINMTAQCGGNVELAKELLKQQEAQ
jgi:hypothetical protein